MCYVYRVKRHKMKGEKHETIVDAVGSGRCASQ